MNVLITGFGQIDIDTESLIAFWNGEEWDILTILEDKFQKIKDKEQAEGQSLWKIIQKVLNLETWSGARVNTTRQPIHSIR